MKVGELMTRSVRTCCETGTLADAAQVIWDGDCGCVPIVSDNGSNRVVGMLTDRDICMATHFRGTRPAEIAIGDIMSAVVHTIGPSENVSDATALMLDAQVRRLPVVDPEQRLVGLISLADLARRVNGRSRKAGVTQHGVSETLKAVSSPRRAGQLPADAS